MSLSPQVLITCAPEKETLIMTPAEKEKIITENRPFIRQHVKQKFPKFMKIYDELCSAAEAAVWLELLLCPLVSVMAPAPILQKIYSTSAFIIIGKWLLF